MTYSWQILNFVTRDEVNGDGVTLSNAVVNIHWKRNGIDSEGNTANVNGYTSLTASSVAGDDFVAFNDLTEETVTTWLNTANADLIASYDEKILSKLAKSSETTRAVPWS